MDSTSESDQFKIIEEQIKDSNVVTFKWLSRKLNIHNTVAKQLLQKFLDYAENKNKYVVTLVVFGKKNDGDLLLSLVKESELQAFKSNVSVIDQHIYSIQPSDSTFDPDMIYNIDKATYELKQLSLSSIKYNKEIICKSVAAAPSTSVIEPQKPSPVVAKPTPQPTKEKPEVKKQESPVNDSTPKSNNKAETKKSAGKPVANSKGSISSFFQKQSDKATTTKSTITSKSTNGQTPKLSDSRSNSSKQSMQNDVSKSEPVNEESSKSEKESPKSNKTESTLVNDGLSKKIDQKTNTSRKSQNAAEKSSKHKKSKSKKTKQKKMKRIILNSDSSSNDEASEEESHFSEPEYEEPEPVIEPPRKESPAVIVTHGKKRKRKILEETVVDDEGFMHTKKEIVYESCSSDENDDAVSNNENLDTNKRIKTDDAEKDDKAKTPSNEEVKSQSQKTKQSSIMSFFKKPQKA